MDDPLFMVGDVISMDVPHPTLPKELEHKFFRVESVDAHGVKLSRPYLDKACTVPYLARYPPPDIGPDVPGGGAV